MYLGFGEDSAAWKLLLTVISDIDHMEMHI